MKKLGFLLLTVSLSSGAFAQAKYDERRVTFNKSVSVHSLNCVTPLGQDAPVEDRVYTELKWHNLGVGSHESIEIDHRRRVATAPGCELQTLDNMVKGSLMTFKHVEAKITVIKGTEKQPRMVSGKCLRNYWERIEIDLGQGIVLQTSELSMSKPATGC